MEKTSSLAAEALALLVFGGVLFAFLCAADIFH